MEWDCISRAEWPLCAVSFLKNATICASVDLSCVEHVFALARLVWLEVPAFKSFEATSQVFLSQWVVTSRLQNVR